MAKPKTSATPKPTDSKRIDAIIALLRRNGISIPPELE